MANDRKTGLLSINDSSTEDVIAVGTTGTVLVAANNSRIALWVSNLSNQAVVIRFRAAAADNLFTGILLNGGETLKVIGDGDVYIGEVSSISLALPTKNITFTEI